MRDELDDTLASLGRRAESAIGGLSEVRRLWLLVSVALERSVVARFMDASEREIDSRVDETRRRVATDVLGEEGAEGILRFRKSRDVLMTFVDAAARRRLTPAKSESWFARITGPVAGMLARPAPLAFGAVAIAAIALIPLSYIAPPEFSSPSDAFDGEPLVGLAPRGTKSAGPGGGSEGLDGETRWWSFDGAAGQGVRIVAGSEAFEGAVALLAADGEELAYDDAGSRLSAVLPADGRYHVRVTTAGDTGPYQLEVRTVPVVVTLLALDGEPGTGELREEGEIQRWSLDGAAGQVIRVAVSSEAFDRVVDLLAPDGGELARDDDGGTGTDSRLEATLPADGRYGVRVTTDTGSGPYQVAVREVAVTQLALDGEPVSGELRDDGERQRWSLDGAAGQVVRVAASSDAFDTIVHLLSPAGEELARNDDGGGGTNSQLESMLPVAGRYQVRVSAYDRAGLGAYQVVARTVPVTQVSSEVPALR